MELMEDFPADITRIKGYRTKRVSSWDRTGGNLDCIRVDAGETKVLADITGPGQINHIYFTMIGPDIFDFRECVLRMFWDGESEPSVEVPFGDFFCVGNCIVRRFTSLMVTVNAGAGEYVGTNNGFNCYFLMPFATGARIEIENQSRRVLGGLCHMLWYHIDYEEYNSPPPDDVGRFHAQWRRENPTSSVTEEHKNNPQWNGVNLDGAHNYVILDAEGQGHLVGVFLNVDNVAGGWYGEGDDMVFIDDDTWPPSLHGTGSEEIFGGGASPDREYAGPYTGFLLVENLDGKTYSGKNAMYRWYIRDPIRFSRSIRVTIEHGHANNYENDYSSVAYWYQKEPHKTFAPLLPAVERIPIFPPQFLEAHAKGDVITSALIRLHERPDVKEKIPAEVHELIPQKLNEKDAAFERRDYARMNELCDELFAILREHAPGQLET
jgi:hypothetical protein